MNGLIFNEFGLLLTFQVLLHSVQYWARHACSGKMFSDCCLLPLLRTVLQQQVKPLLFCMFSRKRKITLIMIYFACCCTLKRTTPLSLPSDESICQQPNTPRTSSLGDDISLVLCTRSSKHTCVAMHCSETHASCQRLQCNASMYARSTLSRSSARSSGTLHADKKDHRAAQKLLR